MKLLGWLLLGGGIISLLFCESKFRRNVLLIYVCLAILGITAITTDISYNHITQMSIALILILITPFFMARFFYKDKQLITFKFHHGRNWYTTEILYIGVTAIVSYFLIPFYLQNTGAYNNWTVQPGFENMVKLFLGTNFLGIWDELFFINIVFGILRKHINFVLANIIQAVLFTSFLYELGFTSWGFIMIFIFALIQGYIFKKTESLLYVITIHLTVDFILYLALIHAYYPSWIPFLIHF